MSAIFDLHRWLANCRKYPRAVADRGAGFLLGGACEAGGDSDDRTGTSVGGTDLANVSGHTFALSIATTALLTARAPLLDGQAACHRAHSGRAPERQIIQRGEIGLAEAPACYVDIKVIRRGR
ncbi:MULTISPECIES: hypothetical protein [unclassified Bradyrhizobium]|uniref:hypothetical protein n=1 Tax=unclassified Bradyrhizobium TaxID=2631580 RepID=UPI001FFAFBC5|nr:MULTISPECIES: hypothetical protein [unclassified Bradyrhizobium]MCK1669674.1 hypothetical protein [Bradyrhizobium sp. 153]MCK1757514.1 hypothetical protein [Bradyrhizobium sp. 137]